MDLVLLALRVHEHPVVVHLGRDPSVDLVELGTRGVAEAGGQPSEERKALRRESRRGGSLEGGPRCGVRRGRLHHGRQQREESVDGWGGAPSSRYRAPKTKGLRPKRSTLRGFVAGSRGALDRGGDHSIGAESPGVLWGGRCNDPEHADGPRGSSRWVLAAFARRHGDQELQQPGAPGHRRRRRSRMPGASRQRRQHGGDAPGVLSNLQQVPAPEQESHAE
mmetsp:Transcript_10826/g.46880  ORF Transcript_10826/g.46880 Transcript_10826/m.46880 type:complete len:221 (-) Transcript_10826:927-1589(-)